MTASDRAVGHRGLKDSRGQAVRRAKHHARRKKHPRTHRRHKPGAPQPTGEGEFYTAPPGYQKAKPGTILRSRSITVALFAGIPQKARAWQLLYRSTDQLGQPEVTVTTVIEPAGATPDPKRPLVGYQFATDSADPACAPSRSLPAGSPGYNVYSEAELLLVDALLAKGYAVSVSDYEGPHAAFGATKQAGYAVLDGLRAAASFKPLGLAGATKTPIGLLGYSGGAVATNGAAEAQPTYAPGLNVRGIAAGGSVGTNISSVINALNGGPGAGLGAAAIAGLSEAYPQITAVLVKYANAKGRAALAAVKTMCAPQELATYAFQNLNTYTTIPLAQLLQLPQVKQVIADDVPGQHAPTAPMYMWQGVLDELLPISGVDTLVAKRCSEGSTIEYRRDLLAEHGIALLTGIGGALSWLDQRLNGVPATPACSTQTVASNVLAPGTAQAFGSQLLYDNFLALLGRPVGPTGTYPG